MADDTARREENHQLYERMLRAQNHGLITRIFEYSNPTVYARAVDGKD